jgi:predicted XRE-type DNA-binding protein
MQKDRATVTDSLIDMVRDSDESAREFLLSDITLGAMMEMLYARSKANLTQAQLAKKLGTSQSVIART